MGNAMGKNKKGFSWPKPSALLLSYCSIVILVELFALAIRDPDPLLLIFIAPVILAAFHYSRMVYLSMALFYTIASNCSYSLYSQDFPFCPLTKLSWSLL